MTKKKPPRKRKPPTLEAVQRRLGLLIQLHRNDRILLDHVQRLVRERETYQSMPSWPLVRQELFDRGLMRAPVQSVLAPKASA